jgi:hypothetical protein
LNYTEHGPIAAGLADIVNYIIISIEKEVSLICPQCNFSFPAPIFSPPIVVINNSSNSTNGSNGNGSSGGSATGGSNPN